MQYLNQYLNATSNSGNNVFYPQSSDKLHGFLQLHWWIHKMLKFQKFHLIPNWCWINNPSLNVQYFCKKGHFFTHNENICKLRNQIMLFINTITRAWFDRYDEMLSLQFWASVCLTLFGWNQFAVSSFLEDHFTVNRKVHKEPIAQMSSQPSSCQFSYPVFLSCVSANVSFELIQEIWNKLSLSIIWHI